MIRCKKLFDLVLTEQFILVGNNRCQIYELNVLVSRNFRRPWAGGVDNYAS